jgi:hypothetical protein
VNKGGLIKQYYVHLLSQRGNIEGTDILEDLPANLRQQVFACSYGKIMKKV